MKARFVYLDSSAIVKLFLDEAELPSLRQRMTRTPTFATSIVAMIEVPRAVARRGPAIARADVRDAIGRMTVVVLDRSLAAVAAGISPVALRSLDAIHLASALELRPDLDAFLTYDRRLALAARDLGLPVESPGVDIWASP